MLQAIILGIVQGLTEFLPISSSGHLVLAQQLLNFDQIDPAFNVFVQGGTVISVLIFFRHKLLTLTRNYLGYLLVATIPAAIIGLFLQDFIDEIFSSLWGVTLGFAITTIIVWLSSRVHSQEHPLNRSRSLKIGLAQAAAILPGLSRSGSTITTSLLLGISPAQAFDFSFLLSIPTIAGATILSIPSINWNSAITPAYLAGFLTASLTGYYSLRLLSTMIKKGKFHLFAPYTLLLSALSVILALN